MDENSRLNHVGKLISNSFVPLTARELHDHQFQIRGHVAITPENFRYDFKQFMGSTFNEDAIHVAATGFRAVLALGQYHQDNPEKKLPPELLGDYLLDSIKSHFGYLKKQYDQYQGPHAAERREDQQTSSARRGRRETVSRVRKTSTLFQILTVPNVAVRKQGKRYNNES